MDALLKRINLSSDFLLTLPMTQKELYSKLSKLTVADDTFATMYGKSDKQFTGKVSPTELYLKPKTNALQENSFSFVRLAANIESTPASVTIKGEIQISKFHLFFMLFGFTVFFIIACVLLIQLVLSSAMILFVFLMFYIGILFFSYKNGIKSGKMFFERELYFLTNNTP